MKLYAVIMAGGVGSRFWPRSRQNRPKQFLNVLDEATMIQNTVSRLTGLVSPEDVYVATHARYADITQRQLPYIPAENLLFEPISRNTAPCIAYAAARIHARDPEGIMMVLPSDHVIEDVGRFQDVLRAAVTQAATPGALVTLGIQPTHPATGYGYIQFDGNLADASDSPEAFVVKTFAEKPDLATAENFLDSGDFLWNSGMFIWRADSVLNAIEEHLPDLHTAFEEARPSFLTDREPAAVRRAFDLSPNISVDYGIMEKASGVYVVPGSFGWNDVGDWKAIYDLSAKDDRQNALEGKAIVVDSSDCMVHRDTSEERTIALVGMTDTFVVETDDAILVCHKDATQQVKHVVEYLRAHQLDELA